MCVCVGTKCILQRNALRTLINRTAAAAGQKRHVMWYLILYSFWQSYSVFMLNESVLFISLYAQCHS